MKVFNPLRLLGALVLLLSLASIGLAAQDQQEPQDQSTPPAAAQQPSSTPSQAMQQEQAFTGKIAKAKGNLVLKDATTSTMYKLDNSDQAKQFVGKNVRVTGTLDSTTNTIHVSNIEAAPGS